MKAAFYAPMKPPGHPTPSGDRRMARLLLQALERAGYQSEVASDLRCYDGKGDAGVQDALIAAADTEAARIEQNYADAPPDIWFTYHCYYKAPDLLGPRVAKGLGIPYVIAEPSRAKKRLEGPWSRFAHQAEAAIDAAQVLFSMGPEDRFALNRDRVADQSIVTLAPFVNPNPEPERSPRKGPARLLSVAMMRDGVKLDSYRALSAGLRHLDGIDWSLKIVGDGFARPVVEALFRPFGDRITFAGAKHGTEDLLHSYYTSDLFLWPGIGEAYGMVYLEAQAAGCPVVAEDHPGPRSVIAPTCALTPSGDSAAYASAIRSMLEQPDAGAKAREYVLQNHSLDSAGLVLHGALKGIA